MTEQEGLQVITQMIKQAQNNFQKGSGNIIIFWGYLVAIGALLDFVLSFKFGNKANLIWLIMIPGFFVNYFMLKKIVRSAIVITHIDHIVNSVHVAFTVSAIVLQFTFWSLYYYYGAVLQFNMMMSVVLLFAGVAQYITGKAYRFRPYINGGIIFWLGAVVCFLILPYVLFHFLILAVCMVFGYIIPGLMLNKKAKENV